MSDVLGDVVLEVFFSLQFFLYLLRVWEWVLNRIIEVFGIFEKGLLRVGYELEFFSYIICDFGSQRIKRFGYGYLRMIYIKGMNQVILVNKVRGLIFRFIEIRIYVVWGLRVGIENFLVYLVQMNIFYKVWVIILSGYYKTM